MFDKAKLHRDDQKGKNAAKKPHEQAAPAEQAGKGPDLPALGGSGAALGGGGAGAAASKAENDPAAMAEQQKELARVKSLPAGSPELEQYKKPEAKNAKVPEGAGAGSAKNEAKGMSPQSSAQAPATLGAPAEKVSKEPGGKSLPVEKTAVYAKPEVSGPAAAAKQNAGKSAPAAGKVEAAPKLEAPKLDKKDPGNFAAEKKEVPAAKVASAAKPAGGGEAKAPTVEPAKSPVAVEKVAKSGDALAAAVGAPAPATTPKHQNKKGGEGAPGAAGEVAAAGEKAGGAAAFELEVGAEIDFDMGGLSAGLDLAAGAELDGELELDAELELDVELDLDLDLEGAAADVDALAAAADGAMELAGEAGELDLEAGFELDLGAAGEAAMAELSAGMELEIEIDVPDGMSLDDFDIELELDMEEEEGDEGDLLELAGEEELEEETDEAEIEELEKKKKKSSGGKPAHKTQGGGGGGGGGAKPPGGGGGGGGAGGGQPQRQPGGGGGGGGGQPQRQPSGGGGGQPQRQAGGGSGGSQPQRQPSGGGGGGSQPQRQPAGGGGAAPAARQQGPSTPAGPATSSGGGGGSIDKGSVSLSLGGRMIVVRLPQMEKGTAAKSVPVRSPGIQGFALSGNANLNFSADGTFTGGSVSGSIAVAGGVLAAAGLRIDIGAQGQMTNAFGGVALRAGPVTGTAKATLGPNGISAHADVQYSEIRAGALGQWLKSGSLSVDVDPSGNVSGGGSLGIQIAPFSAGTVNAQFANNELSGSVNIQNTDTVALGNSVTLTKGSLTGTLAQNDKVTVAGSLELAIQALGAGTGTVAATWDSTSKKVNGSATYEGGEASMGKLSFHDNKVTGTVKDSQLVKVDGQGALAYADFIDGKWVGNVDLVASTASFQLNGKLTRPITQGEASIDEGTVEAKVDNSELTTLTGNVKFKYASYLEGTASIDPGTTLTTLNASANANLVQPQPFGDVTLTEGAMAVKVVGTQVSLVSGSVAIQYKDIAKGSLSLTASPDIHKFSGHAQAELLAGQTWGDLSITGGSLALDFDNGGVTNASGSAEFNYSDFIAGKLAFTGLQDLPFVSGEASAHIIGRKNLTGKLALLADPARALNLKFERSAFKSFTGSAAWEYDKFGGDVSVSAPSTDFATITGEAHADLLVDTPIGTDSNLQALTGSNLSAKIAGGQLTTISGSLRWRYENWLGGTVGLQEATVEHMVGSATAEVLAPKIIAPDLTLVSGNASLEFDSQKSMLDQPLQASLDWTYREWLAGNLTVTTSTLKSLSGSASASIVADYAPGGGQFHLHPGGSVAIDFVDNKFTEIAGNVEFGYENPSLPVEGNIVIQKSPLTAITGEGNAHLKSDSAAVADTKLLAGGNLQLKVNASKPESFGGKVDWLYSTWLGGSLEMPNGTPVAGPYTGTAIAGLKEDKGFGGKFTALKGGSLTMQFNTAVSPQDTPFEGSVAVDYDHWLKGTLTADAGSTLKNLSGSAQVELIDEKTFGLVVLKEGGSATVKFVGPEITGISGHVEAEYDKWLAGSIQVDEGSTLQAINGTAGLAVIKEKEFGEFKLLEGGALSLKVVGSSATTFGGSVDWQYQDWVKGNLTADAGSTFESVKGHGSASIVKEKDLGAEVKLLVGGNAKVGVEASAVKKFSGTLNIGYQEWITGSVTLKGDSDLKTVSGNADINVIADKEFPGQVTVKIGSAAKAVFEKSAVKSLSGNLGFTWADTVEGKLELATGSSLKKVSGHAQIGLMKDIPLAGGVILEKGGNAEADFDGAKVTRVSGTLSLGYDDWLKGTITANTGSTLDQVSGKASLHVVAPKKFGIIEIQEGASLTVDIVNNKAVKYGGNVDVKFEDWLKGAIKFEAKDLNSISGNGSMAVIVDHRLVGPVSLLIGSNMSVNFEKSTLKDFGGSAQLGVDNWGKGGITVKEGSTPKSVSGEGNLSLSAPKPMGDYVTLTKGELGASVEDNKVTAIWGRLDGTIKEFGEGWVQIDKVSTLTNFTGQAGLKLTTPKKIGSFAELSGGLMLANFADNALKDFGGQVDIKVYGWGKGSVQVEAGSTLESIKGSATLELTERKELAGGKVIITGGSASAKVDGQKLTDIAGMIEVQLTTVAKGRVEGQLDVEKQSFSGHGQVQQIAPWKSGPVTISNGKLEATITDNKLTGAAGSADVDAGRIGKGKFQVNYEDVGGEAVIYGSGEINFKPHDRVDGKVRVEYTKEKKLTGEGQVKVKISDKITAMAGVALDEAGHVKLKGSVTVPGPFQLFKPDPYKKDITLLDLNFVVYSPPTVKVKVGAGLGIECGIKPLTLSNVVLGGEVDLMEPAFANMSVSGHLASTAYCDLSAYIQGSVQVSAAVVAVEAGLRAALNLHLEAALSADPTITVNRNGLSFDMPVNAKLTAALQLVLTFFAKVKVGLDLGFFSIMKTVWDYDKSPDPINLASMSIGAKGNVHAGPDGFRGTMTPEYTPPDLSLAKLKQALHI